MLAQKCTGAFIICHNMSIKGARKRPDMRILCRIARGSEASRNPLESLQRRTEAGGILWAYKQNSLIRAQDSDMDPDSNTLRCPYQV